MKAHLICGGHDPGHPTTVQKAESFYAPGSSKRGLPSEAQSLLEFLGDHEFLHCLLFSALPQWHDGAFRKLRKGHHSHLKGNVCLTEMTCLVM